MTLTSDLLTLGSVHVEGVLWSLLSIVLAVFLLECEQTSKQNAAERPAGVYRLYKYIYTAGVGQLGPRHENFGLDLSGC